MTNKIAIMPCLPSQERFIFSSAKHPAFIAGMGTGKSNAIAKRCIHLIFERHNQGINAHIFVASLTVSLTNDTIVKQIIEHLEYYKLRYKWKKGTTDRLFEVWIRGRKHEIKILSMHDPKKMVGINSTDGILDEFDVLKEHEKREVWIKCLTRIRNKAYKRNLKGEFLRDVNGKKIPALNTLAICTTPEYKGFTEYLCIRSAYEDENGKAREYTVPTIAEYIRGETKENVYLSDDFLPTLKLNLSAKRFRSYTLGYFENFQGERVWEMFDSEKHVIKDLKPNGTHVSLWDFGWNDFMYVAIGTIAGDGEIRIMAEYKERKIVLDDFITHYQTICSDIGVYPSIDFCDPAGDQHREQTGLSNTEIMVSRGLNPEWSSSSIREGITIGNSIIKQNLFYVDPKCIHMITMLENHSYPPLKDGSYTEKPLHDQYEAPSAALRYLIVNEHRYTNPVWNKQAGFNVNRH